MCLDLSIRDFYRPLFVRRLPAFTLIELAMVLMIVGLLTGAVLKGRDVLESAQLRSILDDVQRYKAACTTYRELYQAYPGDDTRASDHFGSNVKNGSGNTALSEEEALLFWVHLHKAGLISSEIPPAARIGGTYGLVDTPHSDMPGRWLCLGKGSSKDKGGLLTPKQALSLKTKAEGSDVPDQGDLRFREGDKVASESCIKNQKFNLTVSDPVCVLYVRWD